MKACGKERNYSEQGTAGQERAWPGEAARRATTQLFPPLPPLPGLCPLADSGSVCFSRLPALCRFKQILCYLLICFWLFALQNAFYYPHISVSYLPAINHNPLHKLISSLPVQTHSGFPEFCLYPHLLLCNPTL